MSGFDTITIGSMNMDINGRSAGRLRSGDSNPGKITHAPGGVGRNIAHNLALLGKKSALISAVGDDLYGQELLAQAQTIGLDVSHCAKIKGARSSTYLALLDEGGEMVSAVNDMAIIEYLTVDFFTPLLPCLKSARALILDCNLPQATLDFLGNQPDFPPIFVDAVSCLKVMKIKELLESIHTFKPNRLEAETLSGIRINRPDDMEKVSCWFHERGVKNLVVSDSQHGLYYSTRGGVTGWVSPIKTEIVNVSGAGDACVAGLVCGWLEGWDLAKSSHFAQSCAALTLMSDKTNNPNLTYAQALNLMEKTYEYL